MFDNSRNGDTQVDSFKFEAYSYNFSLYETLKLLINCHKIGNDKYQLRRNRKSLFISCESGWIKRTHVSFICQSNKIQEGMSLFGKFLQNSFSDYHVGFTYVKNFLLTWVRSFHHICTFKNNVFTCNMNLET
jgi:hypothetical protein